VSQRKANGFKNTQAPLPDSCRGWLTPATHSDSAPIVLNRARSCGFPGEHAPEKGASQNSIATCDVKRGLQGSNLD